MESSRMKLARAAKYWLILEETGKTKGDFLEAHKNFVEKMKDYQTATGMGELEAQEQIMEAVEFLKSELSKKG